MKKIIIIFVLLGAVFAIYYFKNQPVEQSQPKEYQTAIVKPDYKSVAYNIDDQIIELKNGKHEAEAAPGSVEIITTQYFGNEVRGDFNADGEEDVAFLITQSGGGTGIFYYIVAALKTTDGFKGTNAIFIGDRIAPQTTNLRNGEIIVNYADRKPDEPFSADPSVGVSRYFKINGSELIEISP